MILFQAVGTTKEKTLGGHFRYNNLFICKPSYQERQTVVVPREVTALNCLTHMTNFA